MAELGLTALIDLGQGCSLKFSKRGSGQERAWWLHSG